MAQLTAEICAIAVVAAAQSFGDDPQRALTPGASNAARRCLGAAANALVDCIGLDVPTAARQFGVSQSTVWANRSKPNDHPWWAAARAARKAVLAHLKASSPSPAKPASSAPAKARSPAPSAPSRTAAPSIGRSLPGPSPDERRGGGGSSAPASGGRPAAEYMAPPPADAAVTRPPPVTGARKATAALDARPGLSERDARLAAEEHAFVQEKRGRRVPWPHIADQLGVSERGLRRRHDPDFQDR